MNRPCNITSIGDYILATWIINVFFKFENNLVTSCPLINLYHLNSQESV